MAANPSLPDEVLRAQQFYTPTKVREILRRGERHCERGALAPLRDLRRPGQGKRPVVVLWEEERVVERVDVFGQLEQLPWFTRQIIYRYYVQKASIRAVAQLLCCDEETVTRHAEDGTELIAHRLGWRGARREARAGSPWVWRQVGAEPQ